MTPDFRLLADDADVTARLRDRQLSLSVSDEDGETINRLEITPDDRDGRIALSEIETELTVALGFAGCALTPLGTYAVESLEGASAPQTMWIIAVAVDLKKAARAPRARAFEGRTLAQIVAQIAGDAGLAAVVGTSIRDHLWPYLAQTADSDLHFLTRIARQIDATAKAENGRLVVVRRGEGTTAGGEAIEPVDVPVSALAGGRWRLKSREVDDTVEAEYSDTGACTINRMSLGDGTPVRRLRETFGTDAEARRAASAINADLAQSAAAPCRRSSACLPTAHRSTCSTRRTGFRMPG